MTSKTPLYDWHVEHGGKLVEFAEWLLPVVYSDGLIAEHLATRKSGGLFDISHMGRFLISGPGALTFLEKVLTNSARKLQPGQAQYTLIADHAGYPLDDAYLYRWTEDEYLLVVNAANKLKAWNWLRQNNPDQVPLRDVSAEFAMTAVQGPLSEKLLGSSLDNPLPPQGRNQGAWNRFEDMELFVSRTGYTGEPIGFELFMPWDACLSLWSRLAEGGLDLGITPVGLGARDTLRLEACLPLYGQEYQEGRPLLAMRTAKFGLDLGDAERPFIGRAALAGQVEALAHRDFSALPQRIMPVAAQEKCMMRPGSPVHLAGRQVGELTSATMMPAWKFQDAAPGEDHYMRTLGLALLNSDVKAGQDVEIAYRKRVFPGKVVEAFAQPVGAYLKPMNF